MQTPWGLRLVRISPELILSKSRTRGKMSESASAAVLEVNRLAVFRVSHRYRSSPYHHIMTRYGIGKNLETTNHKIRIGRLCTRAVTRIPGGVRPLIYSSYPCNTLLNLLYLGGSEEPSPIRLAVKPIRYGCIGREIFAPITCKLNMCYLPPLRRKPSYPAA
jgi:hypothetical protein